MSLAERMTDPNSPDEDLIWRPMTSAEQREVMISHAKANQWSPLVRAVAKRLSTYGDITSMRKTIVNRDIAANELLNDPEVGQLREDESIHSANAAEGVIEQALLSLQHRPPEAIAQALVAYFLSLPPNQEVNLEDLPPELSEHFTDPLKQLWWLTWAQNEAAATRTPNQEEQT